jgi:hypothetical protein
MYQGFCKVAYLEGFGEAKSPVNANGTLTAFVDNFTADCK